jgi:hypothetical protein
MATHPADLSLEAELAPVKKSCQQSGLACEHEQRGQNQDAASGARDEHVHDSEYQNAEAQQKPPHAGWVQPVYVRTPLEALDESPAGNYWLGSWFSWRCAGTFNHVHSPSAGILPPRESSGIHTRLGNTGGARPKPDAAVSAVNHVRPEPHIMLMATYAVAQ